MPTEPTPTRDHRFFYGLAAGTAAGVGLALWCAPKVRTEWRSRLDASVRDLTTLASDKYDQASSAAGAVVTGLVDAGQQVRDDAADAVAHGAREVARQAISMKSNQR